MFIDQPARDVPWAELIRAMPAQQREMMGSVLTLTAAAGLQDEQLRSAALATLQQQAASGGGSRKDEVADEEWRCGNDLAWLLLHLIPHPHGGGGGFDEATVLAAVGRVATRKSDGAGQRIERAALDGLRSTLERRQSAAV